MRELKSCPFCGGTKPRVMSLDNGWCVECDCCTANVDRVPDMESAIAAWNRRAEASPLVTAIEEALASLQCGMVLGAVDTLERAMASAEASRTPQWQPIETAPKDGRELLGWVVADADEFGSSGFVAYSLISWDAGFKSSICDRKPGWHKEWRGEVTHWMPLPEAPGGITDAGKGEV